MADKASPAPAKVPADLAEGWYHIELTEECPFGSLSYGTQTFHKTTAKSTQDADAMEMTYDRVVRGQDVYLYADDLAAIKAAKGKKVIRVVSEKTGRSQIHRTHARRYHPKRGDTPVEKYLIMYPTTKPTEPTTEGVPTLFDEAEAKE